ncbi:RWD domain-containing protein [Kalaharituber pfeilii]|nr:RWD domain-containing protein [Kalaharituber pfeilii]
MELLTQTFSVTDLNPGDERSQELVTVSYIFPELTFLGPHSAYISIPISPEPPVPVVFSGEKAQSNESRTISHFPPIQATFTLPPDYPCNAPPVVKLESVWVTESTISKIQSELLDLWRDTKDQVLYAIIDHLVQAALRAFDQADSGNPLVLPECLEADISSFNKKALKEEFNKGTYVCGVCLEPKKGSACHRLFPCNHAFCINCLQDFYTSCITEGEVSSVKCLDPSCILNKKPKSVPGNPLTDTSDAEPTIIQPSQPRVYLPPTLPPSELEDLGLSPDLVTRYRMLKRKAALAADPKTIYCPRPWCQAPSRSSLKEMEANIDTNDLYLTEKHLEMKKAELNGTASKSETESQPDAEPVKMTDRMDRCSSCSYAFCKVCNMGWHGDYVICRPKNAPKTQEEIATEEYLKSAAAACPTCGALVIKSYGCNHMICRCGTHFCFLCSEYLMRENPYIHFNTEGNKCYQKLWEGEEGDGMAGGGVRPRPEGDVEDEESDSDEEDEIFWLLGPPFFVF